MAVAPIVAIVVVLVGLLFNFVDPVVHAISSLFTSREADWRKPPCVGAKASDTCPGPMIASDPQRRRDFLFEQYQTAAAEIRERISQEHLLFYLKFIVAGAVLGWLLNAYAKKSPDSEEGSNNEQELHTLASSKAGCLSAWSAVTLCTIVDIRLQFNTRIIADLGSWIRNCLEPCLHAINAIGWEAYYSAIGINGGARFRWLLTGDRAIFTGALCLACIYLFVYRPCCRIPPMSTSARELLAISTVFLPTCVLLIGWSGFYSYFDFGVASRVYIGLVFVSAFAVCALTLLAGYLARRSQSRLDAESHESPATTKPA